ncbi:MAG TPA: thioredoxin domain-containing protein [Aminobacterium sp.]|jgi:hypothetical protein|uniref:thioredoxin domain-containing protein n=1 Tax=Aminobacterium TaxID=81466 RepID=UPI000ECE1FBC|nr:thioredoxin domain-containing protein [Aminobacterium sp. UBA4834]HCA41432.1 thioredoxin domain-containing protein [Aminobacterium sp.]
MGRKANRLIKEKSPYLLQHAYNPVDWYPWGKEAFEKAKAENKPIFLSIGYSTCHWCHVMERESFNDDEVALLLNDACVCIKVDREERPDIDYACMAVSLIMNGSGGWPLNLFLTPEGKPFFATSYVPKRTIKNIPGLVEMVPRVKWLWLMKQQEVLRSADSIIEALEKSHVESRGACPGQKTVMEAYKELRQRFDPLGGGFFDAPKFPTPHIILFLLEYSKIFGEKEVFEMVQKTLDRMAMGGIHDHIGGGFSRYATDREWRVPHFEKMLYDQALLMVAYTSAWELMGQDSYTKVVQDIATYVLRDMRDSGGAFYTGEDADSEGLEGRFYLWTEDEIRQVMPASEANLFIRAYGIQRKGNIYQQMTGSRLGQNVLYMPLSFPELAEDVDMDLEEIEKQLAIARAKLFDMRNERVRPHRDEKILTDWNGLMIAALAYAGRVFEEPRYVEEAKRAADFLLAKAVSSDGCVVHRIVQGEGGVEGFLSDYSFLIWGLLELEEATGNTTYGKKARWLLDETNRRFFDEEHGGYFMSQRKESLLFFNPKDIEDGATISGNSVAVMNLLRFHRREGNKDFLKRARRTGDFCGSQIEQNPAMFTHFLTAAMFL